MVRFEVAADITEQRSVNQERMELEKLGAIGRLTAGVAYELNNPIMGMINAIQFCIDQTGMDDERHEVLRNAEHHTRRCIDIVHRLLDFSTVLRTAKSCVGQCSCLGGGDKSTVRLSIPRRAGQTVNRDECGSRSGAAPAKLL